MKRHSILILMAGLLLCSCGSRPATVRTTTYSPRSFGVAASAGDFVTTVTEAPYESETKKSFGRAAENLFARP